jgi:hypothetical protein
VPSAEDGLLGLEAVDQTAHAVTAAIPASVLAARESAAHDLDRDPAHAVDILWKSGNAEDPE